MVLAIIRGGGDLASGVAFRLFRAGVKVIIAERSEPLAVRRMVSFAEAVYSDEIVIEGVKGVLKNNIGDINPNILDGLIPVLVDPNLDKLSNYSAQIIIDARMKKSYSEEKLNNPELVIGLGPGFQVGKNCDCVVETKRGHFLGRVYWEGTAEADSGLPDKVGNYEKERVLRAPITGIFQSETRIGEKLKMGSLIARVNHEEIFAPFDGVVRGLIQNGLRVESGLKVGDLDPRGDPKLCGLISEKALAIGGGVLEAVFSQENIRKQLCENAG